MKGMKRIAFICLIIMSPAIVFGLGSVQSLDDCLKTADKNSPELQSQAAKVEELKFKYYGQIGMMLPQLDASASYLKYGEQLPSKKVLFGDSLDDYYADVSVRQVLFAGGKYFAQTKSARLAFEAEQQKLELTKRTVLLAVKKAYYELARSNYAVKVQIELLDKLKEQSDIAQLLYNSGKTSSLDVLKIQTQVASSEDILNSLKDLVHTRSLLLGQVVGVNEPVTIEDTSPQAKENIVVSTHCLKDKFKDNPELKYVVSSVNRAGYDVKAARSDLMPSLILKANYNFEDKEFFPGNPNWYAGAGISLPLFHGGSTFAQIGQAKARQKQAVDAVRQTEIALQVKFESAVATAADKRNRLKTTKKVLDLSKEALNAAELKYNAGKLTALELIDAQTVWNNAMLTYENNTIDYLITLAEIEYICPQAIAGEAH